MENVDINSLIYLVLGGGLAGTITAVGSAYRSYREGIQLREKGTIEDLISQRRAAAKDRDEEAREKAFAHDQRDYWRNRAADLEYILRQNGVEIPTAIPEPIKPEVPVDE